jgi:hypothetical protein
MSTMRFRDLVKSAGTPEPKSLWTDPKNDRDFMRAVKQNRVLTVVQESKKKDFGELGFHQREGSLYFVFPKPLPAEQGKVIGIKYELAETTEPKDQVSPEELKRVARRAKHPKSEKQEAPLKKFDVLIRRVAVVEANVLVEARSKNEAREKAMEMTKGQGFDLAKAKIESEIESVK